VLLLGTPGGALTAAACWPREGDGDPELADAAKAAVVARQGVVRARASAPNGEPSGRHVVAAPIQLRGGVEGAVAVEVPGRSHAEQLGVVELLQLGSAWLPLAMQRSMPPAPGMDRCVLGLVATALEHGPFHAAATAVVTELATRLSCERVSLGFLDGREIRVEAVSHSARFDERTRLIQDIAAAMEEAVDQEATIVHPPPEAGGPDQVSKAHAALCTDQGDGAVCTLLLTASDRVLGALTLEYPAARSPAREHVSLCQQVAALLGPILDAKRREERAVVRKIWDALRAAALEFFTPDRPGRKLVAAGIATVLLMLTLVPATYRIAAPARLEGTVQRVVVAAMDGYIAESRARAGDVVERGEALAALDDTDLRLERRRWSGRRAQIAKEYRAAMASHDRSQVSIVRAQLEQADAEIALLDEQLLRTRLVAPFDGVVARGDLSQSLGSPVERGEVLFEVAPLDRYRIILEVDERAISDVYVGRPGELTLSAIPDESLPLRVERITPVATSEDSRNFFRVEAHLEKAPKRLRPGMEGVGKIEAGRRSLLWIWTHSLYDWLRLWAWKRLP
jgi:RND family efflux transporter MFP subunit